VPYQVHIAPAAQRDFKRLPLEVVRKVDAAILDLEQHPRPHGCTKLEGSEDEYRVRVGDYRILQSIKYLSPEFQHAARIGLTRGDVPC